MLTEDPKATKGEDCVRLTGRLPHVAHLDITKKWHHDASMRTTLTVDDDLAFQLKTDARRRGESFKAIVNDALRRGLLRAGKPQSPLPRFVVKPKACGFRSGVDVRKLNQLVDELETEDFQRKLSAGSNR